MSISAVENYQGVWGNRIGFGRRTAVLFIDFMQAYTQPGAPLFAEGVVSAVGRAQELLAWSRMNEVPIVHTNIRYFADDCADGGVWVRKAPVMKGMVQGNPLAEFCAAVMPEPGELVITKQYASAFFGTSLGPHLYAQGIDTLVLAGCSTSGCVRATAVDAVQHGFHVVVARECVGDRHDGPHEANLFDIDSKYGDVLSLEDVFAGLGKERGL
ncbi:N-carbamoylsarcosine amidohydrolase [Halopseudomonas xiamenensis]|uniref:N-carbamoylsarcosine amidohydrolase n=1 Tax=Halopseudomonas xiamenensis TaxID=157792 RepID=UPI0016279131|nr:N-carbamoylsarcosine amidohydrolase [Halopseudomonas xiamenensis]